MTSLQVGVDIVEIARVEQALRRFGDRFSRRVYTARELADSGARGASLAARFAAKEATIKALGQTDIPLPDIEVIRPPGARPTIRLHGRAAEHACRLRVVELALSLSHSRDYAVAMVVIRQDARSE